MCDPIQKILQLLVNANTAAFYKSYYFVYEMTSQAKSKVKNWNRY